MSFENFTWMERSSWTVKLSSSNKILVNICFSEKNTLQKTVFGCPCFVSLLGPGKVSFERLTTKRARKLRCGTQKWARRWKGAEIMAQNWTIALGRLAPPPLACVPLSHLILLPCACYIGYSYRILHGKCGRTVFSYELLTYFKKSKEWDFWYKNSNLGNTVQSIFHVVLCSSLILRAFYFKSFWNAKISKKKKKNGSYTQQNWRDKESEEYSLEERLVKIIMKVRILR